MIGQLTDPGDREFSRTLLQAISLNSLEVEIDLPILTGADLSVLKEILRGEKIPNFLIDIKRAINALTRSERSVEAGEILSRIVSDTEETVGVRATAALNLSMMPPEVSEKALLQNLTSADETVQVEVIKALGRIGSAEALARLKALSEPDNDFIKQQLSLAKLAIAFRSGADEAGDWDAKSILGIQWMTHTAKIVEDRQVRENIDAIWGSTYGITLNPNVGFEISCGRAKHFLFLNDVVKRGTFLDDVKSRKMIAGLVALQEEHIQYSTIRYLLLTNPSNSGIELIVARTNGEAVYAGEANPNGAALRLRMRDVGLERTPTEIEGLLSNEDIQLNFRVWGGRAKKKKHGEPIRV
jgi:HEAT repeats